MNAHSTIIADDLAREIAEIEIIDAAEDHHRGAVGAWFMARPLAAKARIASIFSLGGLTLVTAIAQAGFLFPSFAGTAQVLTLIVLAVALLGGLASLRFVLRHVIDPYIKLKDDMARLAQGERDIQVTDTHRVDEIGDLARSFSVFLRSGHKLDELFAGRKKAAEERKAEIIRMAADPDRLHAFVDEIQIDFDEVHEAIRRTYFAQPEEPGQTNAQSQGQSDGGDQKQSQTQSK